MHYIQNKKLETLCLILNFFFKIFSWIFYFGTFVSQSKNVNISVTFHLFPCIFFLITCLFICVILFVSPIINYFLSHSFLISYISIYLSLFLFQGHFLFDIYSDKMCYTLFSDNIFLFQLKYLNYIIEQYHGTRYARG